MSCDKARYPTEDMALRMAKIRAFQNAVTLRVYPCEVCQGFHLTSQVGPGRTHMPIIRPNDLIADYPYLRKDQP